MDQYGYAWVLRWDNETNADEFNSTLRTYLERKGTERNGLWHTEDATFSVTRLTNETVDVLIGPESFVAHSSARGDDEHVTVVIARSTGESTSNSRS